MSSAPPAAIANLRFVKLRDLVIVHPNWKNPRTVTGMDEESLLDLGKDMKARGIQVALDVQQVYKDKAKDPDKIINLVLDGQRRYLGAEEVFDQDAEIPVLDRTPQPIELTPDAAADLMLDMVSVAQRRAGLNAYELSEVSSDLRDKGRTLADIGKAIGRDESWVSKILTARKNADPKLMLRWRKGEITEEQFKDLASIKDTDKQAVALKETLKARDAGDSAEARATAKELAAQFKQETKATNGHAKKPAAKPVVAVRGPQEDLFEETKEPAKPAVKVVIKGVVLEEMLAYADKRPPTADYVRGVIDCVRFMTGEIEMSDFSKAWHAYVSRVSGTSKAKKAKAKARKAKGKKGAKKAKRK